MSKPSYTWCRKRHGVSSAGVCCRWQWPSGEVNVSSSRCQWFSSAICARGGGGERDPVDVPVVVEQLGQSLGDGGDSLDRGLPGEAGFPVRLVVREGPPAAVGMPGVEVDEQAAVGAVDADASACAIVLVRPTEEMDQRADRIGEPVDARSRQIARGDQDPVLGHEGPHRRALHRRRQWARTDRVQRVGASVQETSGTRAGGASYPSIRARGGSGCWARLCEVMGCCGLRWVS